MPMVGSMPNIPPQMPQIVIAQATPHPSSPGGFPRIIGTCDVVENPATEAPGGAISEESVSATNAVGALAAIHYYFVYKHQDVDLTDAKVSMLKGPKHGKIETFGHPGAEGFYIADKGYYGPDRVTFRVTIGGKDIRVVNFLHVVRFATDQAESSLCPNDTSGAWKIASTGSALSAVRADIGNRVRSAL